MSDLPPCISEKTLWSEKRADVDEEVLIAPIQSETNENPSDDNKESETFKTETCQGSFIFHLKIIKYCFNNSFTWMIEYDLANSLNDSLKITNKPIQKLETLDIDGLSKYLLTCKNIVFMNGAGISTCRYHNLTSLTLLNL